MRQIGNIKSTYASDVALIAAKLQLEDDDCRSHAEEDGRSGSAADPQLSSQQAAWSRKAFICAHCDDGGMPFTASSVLGQPALQSTLLTESAHMCRGAPAVRRQLPAGIPLRHGAGPELQKAALEG